MKIDREDLMKKIEEKLNDMSDMELKALANSLDVSMNDDMKSDDESSDLESAAPAMPKPIVDTSVLAGPIPALKNFLIKKQQDNDKQS